ncbi:hypothetical protein LCGC14_2622570 [marine sediment metagenome]|uniref:Uncharacterized protein n=1 Tax=marine sediment metagenome TaxID=412755 RepID=A0A0F9AQA1_9ZZZZ
MALRRAARVLAALASCGGFRLWTQQCVRGDAETRAALLRQSLQLRALLEVHCYRRCGGGGAASAEWAVYARAFACETGWLLVDEMQAGPVDALLQLMCARPNGTDAGGGDAFRTVESNPTRTELHYRHFAYDECVERWLRGGLGLLLFAHALDCAGQTPVQDAELQALLRAEQSLDAEAHDTLEALLRDGDIAQRVRRRLREQLLRITKHDGRRRRKPR